MNTYYKTKTIYGDFLLILKARNNITIKEKDGHVTLLRSGSQIGNCSKEFFENRFQVQEAFENHTENLIEEHKQIRKDI